MFPKKFEFVKTLQQNVSKGGGGGDSGDCCDGSYDGGEGDAGGASSGDVGVG